MTQGQVALILVLSLLVFVGVWAVVEWRTLSDNVQNNHITAIIRNAYHNEPGVFILAAFILGYFFGHFFWGDNGGR